MVQQERKETETMSSASKMNSKSSRRTKAIRFAGGSSNWKSKEQELRRPLLTDAHENLNKFSSATGETVTATKWMDKEQQFFLQNNKGIAVVFTPHEGMLYPHSEIPITVTVYNNACGKFEDTFIS